MAAVSPTSVGPAELKKMLHDGAEIALIDVREAAQFGESHLLFATPMPYSRFELDVPKLLHRKSARIVLCGDDFSDIVHCAASTLLHLGYSHVAVLRGGIRAWSAAGYNLFRGVNVPGKAMGELVELVCQTPRITAREMVSMKEEGQNFIVVDGRPFSEYTRMNIPGSICCPNAELPYRIAAIAPSPNTKIIVNCAGRTRSIIGAQTLINFDIPNPVMALENGTQGWYLENLKLEKKATRRYPERVENTSMPAARQAAKRLMNRLGISTILTAQLTAWLEDPTRTTYLFDVRTAEEFSKDAIPGTVNAPGGQLIQATEEWVGVRHARVVLIDNDGIRAPMVASWLVQLGYDASVLSEGIHSKLRLPNALIVNPVNPPHVSASALNDAMGLRRFSLIDLNYSMNYRRAHIVGAIWSTRVKVKNDIHKLDDPIVLICNDIGVAQLVAADLQNNGRSDVQVLAGGMSAWTAAGFATVASPDQPMDGECIDHLFLVRDRNTDHRAAMQQYLAWETGLVLQLDEQERAEFRVTAI